MHEPQTLQQFQSLPVDAMSHHRHLWQLQLAKPLLVFQGCWYMEARPCQWPCNMKIPRLSDLNRTRIPKHFGDQLDVCPPSIWMMQAARRSPLALNISSQNYASLLKWMRCIRLHYIFDQICTKTQEQFKHWDPIQVLPSFYWIPGSTVNALVPCFFLFNIDQIQVSTCINHISLLYGTGAWRTTT